MTELARWQPADSRDVVDGWVGVLVQVEQLSRVIAGTEFVPAGLRGKPAAVGAAILAGRELGIGPMTSLQHLHVIDGRPSMSAQLMRALVLAHGHSIRVVESTSTRCTMRGRRAGEDEWTDVTWTTDDARRAGIDGKPPWRKMPRAMLAARATGELCRLVFADVIGGMAYTVEEADDAEPADLDGREPARPVRTIQRRQPRRVTYPPERAEQAQRAAEDERQQPDVAPTEPATAPTEPEPVEPVEPSEPEREALQPEYQPTAPESGDRPASQEQQRHLFALLRDLGADEPRERRLQVAQALLARRVVTFAQLTSRDAAVLIDSLGRVKASDKPSEYLAWVVQSGLDHLTRLESTDVEDGDPDDDVPDHDSAEDDAEPYDDGPGFDDEPDER